MATYQYTARTLAGQQVTGVLQAESPAAVARALDEKKLFPVRVAERGDGSGGVAGGGLGGVLSGGGRRLRPRDLGVLYGQVSDLVRSGVPLMRALDTLIRAGTNKPMVALLRETRDAIASGDSLADAFAKRTGVVPPLHVAMVRAGERGGFLEDVLANLATFIERQDEVAGKVLTAMIYPAVLVFVGLSVMMGMLIALVPQFKPIFQGAKVPALTHGLFAVSDLMVLRWPLLLAGLFLLGMGVYAAAKSESGRRAWDRYRIKLPLFGKAIKAASITRFCRILGTMLANGVPLLASLSISKDAAGSVVLAEAIEAAAENVRAGQPLHAPLRDSGLFPAEVLEMIAVAEESNQLEKVLVQIADTVERRTNRQIDSVVKLIEPLILMLMAALIGTMAVALLYPIFTMSQALK